MDTITCSIDDHGIATLSIAIRDQPVNVLSAAFRCDLREAIERVASDPAVRGAILTSAKSTFIAGADLKDPEFARTLSGKDERTLEARLAHMRSFGDTLRRMETSGKPFAVAINGSALGGGFEICLACQYRVIVDAPGVKVGLPEVTLGLMPAAGGTQRVPRLLGIAKALPLLLQGKALSAADAVAVGLIDATAPAERLIEMCRDWILSNPDASQPWDRTGFTVPGGTSSDTPEVAELLLVTTKNLEQTTHRNYPGPLAILSAVDAGTQRSIDAGLDIEIGLALDLWSRPGAGNMMRTLFINKSWLDKFPKRPGHVTRQPLTRIGIVGAGVMGAGIAQAAAKAGIVVTLLDRDLEAAQRGKATCAKSLARAVERQASTREKADALLARIHPTDKYSDFSDCSIVVEAVFENRDVKAAVITASEAVLPTTAIFASNTSTLPITSLARHSERPDRFIGLHFFSPVDRMPLVEVIRGEATSDETLAIALDLVAAMRKTPIVVNDGRGFFTSRCFGAMSNEAAALLEAGIDPALIEQAALGAGMPVAPLTLSDIMGADLSLRVDDQARADLGSAYVETPGIRVRRRLALEHGRKGKAAGGGFYDYAPDGSRQLWAGLAEIWPVAARQPALDDVKKAMLFSQSLEAVRALDEGVLEDPVEGDVGSVIGWGFPAYTGGVFSLIDTYGSAHFAAECARLAKMFGPRFAPPAGLVAKAQANAAFVEARL